MDADALEEAQTTVLNLAESSTKYLSSLSGDTSLLLEDLGEIQKALNDLQVRCKLECLEIDRKYHDLQRPFLDKLGKLISRGTPTSKGVEEHQPRPPKNAVIGVPNFWPRVLENHLAFHDLIEEHDQDALKHLADIRLEYLGDSDSPPGPGYRILFEFSSNDYFENSVLSKTYQYDGTRIGPSGDFVTLSSTGTTIDWKKGKNLTQRVNGDLRCKWAAFQEVRTILTRTLKVSFFHFFAPLTEEEIEEAEKESDEDWLAMIDDQIEEDYQLGAALKDQIIPHPVDWFMGRHLIGARTPVSTSTTVQEIPSLAVKPAPRYGYKATLESLVQNADIELARSLLFLGAQHGYVNLVKLLLDRHSRGTQLGINSKDHEGRTSLYVAAREGHEIIVELLVRQDRIDLNSSKGDGATPLFIAAWNGHEGVVKILLGHSGVEVNAYTHSGETPLYAAAQNGHEGVVKLLLNHGSVEANFHLKTGATPIYVAARNGLAAVVKLLIDVDGIDLNSQYQDGSTPLFVAAQNDHVEVVKLLVSQPGIDVNLPKNNGATPLYIAANAGSEAIVKTLLGVNGIDLNFRSHGTTPYLIAVQKGHKGVAALLEPDKSTPHLLGHR